jgi:hypothetical protein
VSQDYDFEIEQGTIVAKLIEVFVDGVAANLTNYGARLQAREKLTDTVPVLDLDNDVLGGLTIDEGAGTITLVLTPEQTAALDFGMSEYNLEIFTVDDAEVFRILRGFITLSKEFTR